MHEALILLAMYASMGIGIWLGWNMKKDWDL